VALPGDALADGAWPMARKVPTAPAYGCSVRGWPGMLAPTRQESVPAYACVIPCRR